MTTRGARPGLTDYQAPWVAQFNYLPHTGTNWNHTLLPSTLKEFLP
jgi:hypothetical protein